MENRKIDNNDLDRVREEWDRAERGKRMLLWSGVVFFMILTVFVWAVNTKKNFSQLKKNSAPAADIDVKKISADLGQVMENMKVLFGSASSLVKENLNQATSSSVLPENLGEISDEEMEKIKIKLEKASASGSASSSEN